MTKTVTRLFDSHTDALAAVRDLENAGIADDRISLVASNADNWHDSARRDSDGDGESDAAEGAGKGATTGGLIGGGAGLLAGLGMLAIPGLGPVVAAGWLVSTAVGAAIGAAAGGATGGILGALKDAGHTDEEAQVYAESVRRGGSLVCVRVDDDDAMRVEGMLQASRGVDAASRGPTYRQAGWQAFDQNASPYTADEVARERTLHGEDRSFAGHTAGEAFSDENRDRPGMGDDAPIPGTRRDV